MRLQTSGLKHNFLAPTVQRPEIVQKTGRRMLYSVTTGRSEYYSIDYSQLCYNTCPLVWVTTDYYKFCGFSEKHNFLRNGKSNGNGTLIELMAALSAIWAVSPSACIHQTLVLLKFLGISLVLANFDDILQKAYTFDPLWSRSRLSTFMFSCALFVTVEINYTVTSTVVRLSAVVQRIHLQNTFG